MLTKLLPNNILVHSETNQPCCSLLDLVLVVHTKPKYFLPRDQCFNMLTFWELPRPSSWLPNTNTQLNLGSNK